MLIGADGIPAVGPLGLRSLGRAVRLRGAETERVGRDLLVRARVQYPR